MQFDQLGLAPELLRAVSDQGYTTATPVQSQAIPAILQGSDMLAAAQTGTGKTAGFTLPMLQRLVCDRNANGKVSGLILTPTRELAAQVHQSVKDYGQHLNFRSVEIFGGVSIRPQQTQMRRGMDIVVATPGRLLDHMQQRTINLADLKMLVLDEADRMLDMGFIHDIRRIVKAAPAKRQTLMFSATFSKDIRKLAKDFLVNPVEVQVAASNSTAERVTQRVYPVDKGRKRELLSELIGQGNWQQVLVFTRTKHGANRLAKQLGIDGIEAMAIHGNKSQGARTRALADFKSGAVRVLVATDIAARGLDIEKLPHVVNYELPMAAEDYVHRIGRTARAGQQGEAISLYCIDEERHLRDIERLLKSPLDRVIRPGFEVDPSIKAQPPAKPGQGRRKSSSGPSRGRGKAKHRGPSGRGSNQRTRRKQA
ncbi:MAG: DEAD/DEAH box helicase [Lysobacterales bacterium]